MIERGFGDLWQQLQRELYTLLTKVSHRCGSARRRPLSVQNSPFRRYVTMRTLLKWSQTGLQSVADERSQRCRRG